VHSPQRASSEEEAQKARTTIIAAFEFVMNAVGSDIKSGDLWMRYLRFVKAGEVNMNRFVCSGSDRETERVLTHFSPKIGPIKL
jgi:hypothetical protein